MAYTLLSVLFYVISFPPVSFNGLAFISLVPFLAALDRAGSLKRKLACGFLFGAALVPGMGYWLYHALAVHYEKPALISILFITFLCAFPFGVVYALFAAACSLCKRRTLLFYTLTVPSFWVLAEYLKEVVSGLIPWGGLGYAVLPFRQLVQIADIVGVYGVTFWVVMINGLIWYLMRECFRKERAIPGPVSLSKTYVGLCGPTGASFVLLALLFAVPLGYGGWKINHLEKNMLKGLQNNGMDVSIVQGNFNTKERWSGMGFYNRIRNYMALSNKGEPGCRRLVIWPETILNSTTKINPAFFDKIRRFMGEDTLLISGGIRKENRKMYNTAWFIGGDGFIAWADKHILLPFAENRSCFDLLGDFYTAPSAFDSGPPSPVIESSHGKTGISICLEILYPGYVRKMVAAGAGFLVNISNDSWFGRSAMPVMHLDAARFRAIENRRYVLRASNSGISAIINPLGDTVVQSALFSKEKINGRAAAMQTQTIYTRFGDVILYMAFLIACINIICFFCSGGIFLNSQ